MTKTSSRYSPEVRARAVRMVQEHAEDHPSRWAAIGVVLEVLAALLAILTAIANPTATPITRRLQMADTRSVS